jgi:hypothetical protein
MRLPAQGRVLFVAFVLLCLHAVGILLFFVDYRLPLVLGMTVAGVAVAIERPLLGIGLLIAGRLTSTGANAWIRIGKINIDLFEPSLLLALGSLFIYGAIHHKKIFVDAPWRTPVLAFVGLQAVSFVWSSNKTECVQEIIATCILLATTLAILAFIRGLEDIRTLIIVWVGVSLVVSLASALGLAATESEFEMAQGSRASGFGQHPNWFSMNLMFSVLMAFGMGIIDATRWRKLAWFAAGTFIFIAQMESGSRGGTGALMIGGGICVLTEPRLRRLAMIIGPILTLVIGTVLLLDIGDAANAFGRIFNEDASVFGKSVRFSNWYVCWQMLLDTWGLGIGGGGYEDLLAHYDWWLFNSQYKYPHGIFWGMMAHHGVLGILVWGWFISRIGRMCREMLSWTRREGLRDGKDLRMLMWCFVATMFGYFAWSFFEFLYDDKPFWEYLGLFTALWVVIQQRVQELDGAARVVPVTEVLVRPLPTPEPV